VDGNVERVLQRIAGQRIAGEELWNAAGKMLDRRRPGDFNQAMMEMGATICTPRTPACLTCPVIELCATRGELTGTKKASRQVKRDIHYTLNFREGSKRSGEVLLVQRPRDASLMAGMWELPEISPPLGTGSDKNTDPLFTVKHSITVTDYRVKVWRTDARTQVTGKWICVEQLARVALTGLARKILRKAEIMAVPSRQLNRFS
jgi:A/G-specific adenine glycosylase